MTNTSDHALDCWKPYLSTEDYIYLNQYIENVKNAVLNEKMIILSGPARTGKTTLKNDIITYLGNELCGNYLMSCDLICDENIKRLGFFCGIDEISRSKKRNQALINFIKYKQSFIADTNNAEKVNKKLLEYCRVIKMDHVFPTLSTGALKI
jgi:predicted AAA+ superfamily ATPase